MAILHSLRLVEVALFLDALGLSSNAIISPYFFVDRLSREYGLNQSAEGHPCAELNVSDEDHSLQKLVESEASRWAYYCSAASLLPAIPLALVMGRWSDRRGRLPVLAMGALGNVVNYAGLLACAYFSLPLFSVLFFYMMSGLLGGRLVVLAAVFAYIVDDSTATQRTSRFSILEGIIFVAAGIGAGLTGFLIRRHGIENVLLGIVTTQVMFFLYVVLFLKESLSKSQKIQEEQTGGVRVFFQQIYALFLAATHYRRQVWVLLIAFLVLQSIYVGTSSVDLLFARLKPFCFGSDMVGYLTVFKCSLYALCGFIIAPLLMSRLGLSDHFMSQMGTSAYIISKLILGTAVNVYMLFTAQVFAMMMNPVPGVLRSMMSKLVPLSQQGMLFAMAASVESLSGILGGLMFNNAFSYFVKRNLPLLRVSAGYTYFVMSGVLLLGLSLLSYSYCLAQSPRRGYQKLSGLNFDKESQSDSVQSDGPTPESGTPS